MNKPPEKPKASIWKTIKAVAWAFLGVRRKGAFAEDIVELKPYHLIAVGLVAGFLFVIALMLLVKYIV